MSRRAPFSVAIGQRDEAEPLWVLNALPPATAREVERWLDQIAELPLDDWLGVAERCATPDQAPLAMTRACKRIERIIAEQALEFTAWLVRDLVDAATHRVRQAANREPRRVRARVAVARMAAEWAALARACQPWLSPEDHDLLCAPFVEPSPRRVSAVI